MFIFLHVAVPNVIPFELYWNLGEAVAHTLNNVGVRRSAGTRKDTNEDEVRSIQGGHQGQKKVKN